MNDDRRLNCLRCGTVMQSEKVGDVTIDCCPDCRGVWLDSGELAAIVKSAVKGADLDDHVLWREADRFKGRISEVVCPHCGSQTVEVRHGGDGPMIDICAGCGGVWLDADELRAIVQQSAAAEGIQHVVMKDLSESSKSLAEELGFAEEKIETGIVRLGATLQLHHPYIMGMINGLNSALGG
ncbi:MAG: zf-TFIIB domain-containing protein [Planctomycetes bacterium]|nr:zf-TFIIB domain-containing protein [Planctomycetota bacterium]